MTTKKILIDINHPAHVHLFKHVIADLHQQGYQVIVAAKEVDSIMHLLTVYHISYISTGKKRDGLLKKYFAEFLHLIQLIRLVRRENISYGIGVSMVLPLVSKLTRMKSIVLDDDDLVITPVFGKFVSVANVILTPSSLAFEDRGPNRICHNSFHELAYLHPNRFVPDPAILDEIGVQLGEAFFILRFNAFKAHHDLGAQGLSMAQKLTLVALLKPYGKVFITTERAIDPLLQPYQMPIAAEKIHSLMYYATMFIGDSQTMISEAALLGTPSIKLNSFAGRLSIPNEIEERYGLCYSFQPVAFNVMVSMVTDLLRRTDLKAEWSQRRARMLADKIELTSFMVALLDNLSTPDRLPSHLINAPK